MRRFRSNLAFRVALLYLLAGSIWILFTDQIAVQLFPNILALTEFQTYKGWFFVLASTLVLFLALNRIVVPPEVAEREFEDLLERTVEGVFQSTPDGRYRRVNPAMARIYGYKSPEDMIASVKNISTQVHVDADSREHFIHALEEHSVVEGFEARNYKKDGSIIWTSTNAHVVRDSRGKALYYEGFVTDITARKRAEESLRVSEARYRALVENLPLVAFLDDVDEAQTTLYIGPQIETLTGYTPEEWMAADMWTPSIHPDDRDRVVAEDRRTNVNGVSFHCEYRMVTRDGRVVWVKEDTVLVRNENGDPLFWQGIIVDITSQKKSELALTESETRYRTLVEQLPTAVYVDLADESSTTIYASPQSEALTGYTPEEWLADYGLWAKILHPEDRERVLEEHRTSNKTGNFNTEYRMIRKDGEVVWIRDDARLIRDEDGAPKYWQGVLIDITQQKTTERALRESEARFSQIFHSSPVVMVISDLDGGILDVNTSFEKVTGYSRDEVVGLRTRDLHLWVNPTERDEIGKRLERKGFVHDYGYSFRKKTGEIGYASLWADVIDIGGEKRVVSTSVDITERIKVEKSLRFSEDRFRKTFQSSPVAICITNLKDGRFIDVNDAYIQLSGYDREELIGRTALELKMWRSEEERQEWVDRLLKEKSIRSLESPFITASGNVLDTIAFHEQIELGGEACVLSLFYDVSKEKEARETLRQTAETYEGMFNSITEAIYIQNEKGEFLNVNEGAVKMYGYPREFFIGKTPEVLSAPGKNNVEEVKRAVQRAFQGIPQQFEFWGKRSNGEFFPKDVRLYKGTYFGQEVVFAIAQDITERRNAQDARERQLRELTVLHELATASSRAESVDALVEKATEIIGNALFPDILGFLLITEDGQSFYPHASYRGIIRKDRIHSYLIGEGVAGQVAATAKPMRVPDVRTLENYIEINPETRSELCVPMIVAERVIGVINAESKTPAFFTEEDERLLVTIAGQLGTAIERLRSQQAEHEQRVLAEALRDTGVILTSSLDLDKVMDSILETLGRVLPSETASIMLINDGIARFHRHRGFQERGLKEWIESLELECSKIPSLQIVIDTGKPLLVSDTETDPAWIRFPPTAWIRSALIAPIKGEDTVIGFIDLDHNQPGFFTAAHAERLMAFANQAAIAVQNARSFEREQRRRQEAETLREAGAIITTTMDTGQAIQLILNQLARVVPYDSASVLLLKDGFLEIVGGRGWADPRAVLGIKFPVPGDNPNTVVIQERRPHIVNDTARAYAPFNEKPHAHIKSWLGVPLIAQNQVIGMLAVDSIEPNHFNEEHARLVSAFANQAAVAIENTRLLENSQEQVSRLTALRDVDMAIASSLDLRVTLNILLDHALTQLNAGAIDILLYNQGLQHLTVIRSVGFRTAGGPSGQIRISDSLAGKVTLSRRPLHIYDLKQAPEYPRLEWLASEGFASYVGVPLLGKGQVKGVLEVFTRSEFSPTPGWMEFLHTLAGQAAIAIDNSQLFENLQRSNQELYLAYDTTLEGWGKALELRDRETQGHTRRVTDMTLKLARRLGIGDSELTHIRRGVLLHDIGKMGVPDHILNKPGALNEEERYEMRRHPQYAYDLLYPIAYLRPALDIPYCHHERWDGKGYPRGLSGEEIPLAARIFAVVDVWDALLSERPYRGPWSREETLEYIRKETGTHFDPLVVEVFFELIEEEKRVGQV
ncbi:MAG: PAS domain S-box protein [Chloroflexota bacterium]